MTATIRVEKTGETHFRVTVAEGQSRSSHTVTLRQDYWRKLTGERISAEELVRKSFEFLLEREPKESVLKEFDLPVIGSYFPEYESAMKRRLDS